MGAFRYLPAYTIPVVVFYSMTAGGWMVWLPVIYVLGVIPGLDLLVGADHSNLSLEQEARAKSGWLYTLILWGFIPLQFGLLFWFGHLHLQGGIRPAEYAGIVLSIALSNGGIGITIAHELIHRSSRLERWLGRVLLMSVLYMHFAIEHVRGHHALVATHEDPASARLGQSFYGFLFPSIVGQYRSAWHLEAERLRRAKKRFLSFNNEMIIFSFMQVAFFGLILLLFGWVFAALFLLVSFVSFSLLEIVNYLEHYGLQRGELERGRYEKVSHHHSWNSDHTISRMFLFELTRHSDHHAVASKKYQVLRTFEDAPQLPTGYPGMILIALVPPLWFRIMDPRARAARSLQRAPRTP
jgi:alkane 1-monooxygenase